MPGRADCLEGEDAAAARPPARPPKAAASRRAMRNEKAHAKALPARGADEKPEKGWLREDAEMAARRCGEMPRQKKDPRPPTGARTPGGGPPKARGIAVWAAFPAAGPPAPAAPRGADPPRACPPAGRFPGAVLRPPLPPLPRRRAGPRGRSGTARAPAGKTLIGARRPRGMDAGSLAPFVVYDDRCRLCAGFARRVGALSGGAILLVGHYSDLGEKLRGGVLGPGALEMFWFVDGRTAFGGRAALLPLAGALLSSRLRRAGRAAPRGDAGGAACADGCRAAGAVFARSASLVTRSRRIRLG